MSHKPDTPSNDDNNSKVTHIAAAAQITTPPTAAWRQYIYILLPLTCFSILILLGPHLIPPSTHRTTIIGASLTFTWITTILCFLLATAIYPSNNPPARTIQDAVPWTRRSLLNRLAVNFVYDFLRQGALNPGEIVLNSAISYGITFISSSSPRDPSTTIPAKAELKIALKWTAIVFVVYMLVPSKLDPIANHFFRVYLRVSFISFVDVGLDHLAHPPRSFWSRLLTLLLELLTTSLACMILLTTAYLVPAPHCSKPLYDLLFSYACYSQISPIDPRALHRESMCFEEHGVPQTIAMEMLREPWMADKVAEKCGEHDMQRAWMQACLAVAGKERGHQFGEGECSSMEKTIMMLGTCGEKFGLGPMAQAAAARGVKSWSGGKKG
ncbi:hypothetical protein K432DRAFT_378957 [Lepidopterella palustris CBS 459.81]|uniref:Uncharacterized protein n=1 Tax=Lepidopterella palustris CBS 459.81 TaxID=1314670 RepID=A0A8E2JJ70_9PEZI|nr:hypothetical protein K432DRAFT_378957 [Lepidopterella palustris CBS 459.81]